MSTKIYYARKFPLEKLAEFMAFVRPEMFKRIGQEIEKLMAGVESSYVEAELAKNLCAPEREESVKRTIRFLKAQELIRWRRPEKADPGYPLYSVDCGWNIYLFKGNCYAYVWGHEKLHNDIEYPEWAEDYAYWNNTDRPDEITDEEWNARGDTWHEILDCRQEYARRLQYVVFDTSFSHAYISLTEMQRHLKVGWFTEKVKETEEEWDDYFVSPCCGMASKADKEDYNYRICKCGKRWFVSE